FDHDDHQLTFYGAGWPLRALWYMEDGTSAAVSPVLHGGIALSGRAAAPPGGTSFRCAALPGLPIWPGLAGDAILFAFLLGAIILGPRALRRALRARRSLCFRCGYPAGGATCSECGARLASSFTSQPRV